MPGETPIGYSLTGMVIAHDFSRGLEEMIASKCKAFAMNCSKSLHAIAVIMIYSVDYFDVNSYSAGPNYHFMTLHPLTTHHFPLT